MATATSKTIDDAIYESRLAVNDATVPYRNTDDTYLRYLNSALRALYSVRPDAFIGNFSQGILSAVQILTYDATDLQSYVTPPIPAVPFPADDRFFFNPVVTYIAGRIELADDEYVDTARSAQLLAAFLQQTRGM